MPNTECRIKWPNDIYLGDKKVAGILIQNSISGSTMQSSIVGIGLNVNQLEFSGELLNPVSLAGYFGREFDRKQLLDTLCGKLEEWYLELKAGKLEEIKAAYETRLYRWNELVRFERASDGLMFDGMVLGVNGAGLLRVGVAGEEVLFDLKALRWIVD